MPELIEVELYAESARRTRGRRVVAVETPDAWYLKGAVDSLGVADAVVQATVVDVRRIGKLLLVDLSNGVTLGLRFGMTGRLLVDGDSAIDRLVYGPARQDPAWTRFGLQFEGGGSLVLQDARRLGGVYLDPDESALGIDATRLTAAQLRVLLTGSTAAIKARLMDQSRVAGLGNLLTDEILWRARLDPARAAAGLDGGECQRLAHEVVATVAELAARGGSHLGDLQAGRERGGRCPRCRSELWRRRIAGRTTYSCPTEQS